MSKDGAGPGLAYSETRSASSEEVRKLKARVKKLNAALKEAVEALKNIKSETLKTGHAQFTVLEHSRAIVDETLARIEEALK